MDLDFRVLSKWLIPVGTAIAAVAASILVPSFVITVHAVGNPDAHAIAMMAQRTAEPLALLGAGFVTFYAAERFAPRPALKHGLVAGLVAAAGMTAAAFWVNDVDLWTAAAAALLPAIGALGGRLSRRERADRQAMRVALAAEASSAAKHADDGDGPTLLAPPLGDAFRIPTGSRRPEERRDPRL